MQPSCSSSCEEHGSERLQRFPFTNTSFRERRKIQSVVGSQSNNKHVYIYVYRPGNDTTSKISSRNFLATKNTRRNNGRKCDERGGHVRNACENIEQT